MNRLWTCLILVWLAAPGMCAAGPRPKPLEPQKGAVIGGWTGKGPVEGIVLQPIVDRGGCLELGSDTVLLADRIGAEAFAVSSIQRIPPGRYAVAGAQWSEPWLDQYDMAGLSRPRGQAWIVDVKPGVVTDVGIWPITSPYVHRYVPGDPDLTKPSPGAEKAAEGVAPLVQAQWSRATVADHDGCTAAK